MPANVTQAIFGTVLYEGGMVAILAILAMPLGAVNQTAYQKSADSLANSVSSQLDALRPGMTTLVQVQYGNVSVAGSMVHVDIMGAVASDSIQWHGDMDFASGKPYAVALTANGSLEVS